MEKTKLFERDEQARRLGRGGPATFERDKERMGLGGVFNYEQVLKHRSPRNLYALCDSSGKVCQSGSGRLPLWNKYIRSGPLPPGHEYSSQQDMANARLRLQRRGYRIYKYKRCEFKPRSR